MVAFRSKPDLDPIVCRPLQIEGQEIPFSSEARYLGVQLDEQLTFVPHILNKMAAAKRLLFKYRNSLGIFQGPQPTLVRWLYIGVVRPLLSYGCVVWGHKIQARKFWSERFRTLQRTLLYLTAPKRKSVPTAGLEMLTYVQPFEVYVRTEMIMAFLRTEPLFKNDTWSGRSTRGRVKVGHRLQIQRWIEEMDLDNVSHV